MTGTPSVTPPVPPPAPWNAVRQRAPALPVACSFAIGIAIDFHIPSDFRVWITLAVATWLAWLACFIARRSPPGVVLLLMSSAVVGGLWHHLRWSIVRPDHIAGFATEAPSPVRLNGRITESPVVVPKREQDFPSAIPQHDHTLFLVECRELVSADQTTPVSGLARIDVAGHVLHATVGDEIDVVGQFALPTGPRNPGAFDFRRFLRASGVHVLVRCEEPDDVRIISQGKELIRHVQARLRRTTEQRLNERLTRQTAPVGVALLLGTRTNIPEELRIDFAESGTMHILAISGSNVGILAGLLWVIARILGFRRRWTVAAVLGGILAYAFLADNQPPVLRAVLMIFAVLAGRPWHRNGSPINALALAALGVLVWNPSNLFDVSAQLSFLAVAALLWAPGLTSTLWNCANESPLDKLDTLNEPAWRRGARMAFRWLVAAHVTMAAIWLFTLPLTMARFHLLSPIGFGVNVLLAPVVVLVLWCGYALLLTMWLAPPLAGLFAVAFDAGLRLMLSLVAWGAERPWGHLYLAGPTEGWLVGFYFVLILIVAGRGHDSLRWVGWRLLLVWIIGGLGFSLVPSTPGELRCSFLSVGHGVAVLIEMPNGRTILYDTGQLADGRRAQQIVQSALWNARKSRIDALVLSHADVDHFNGVPGLARTIPIGTAFAHSSFLDFKQRAVVKICDALAERNIPLRLIWQGDRIPLDDSVTLRILHPPVNDRARPDNANSIVLAVEYAGRRILLTGDLEQSGLYRLLAQPRLDCDLLLSPHHGSPNANPRMLADWATPDYLIISGGRPEAAEKLQNLFGPETRVLSTTTGGAAIFTIGPDGDLRFQPRVERGTSVAR